MARTSYMAVGDSLSTFDKTDPNACPMCREPFQWFFNPRRLCAGCKQPCCDCCAPVVLLDAGFCTACRATPKEYAVALTLAGDRAAIWANVASELEPGATVTVGGKTYDKLHCYLKALRLRPQQDLWANVAAEMRWFDVINFPVRNPKSTGGHIFVALSTEACYRNALYDRNTAAGRNPVTWLNLALHMPARHMAQIYDETPSAIAAAVSDDDEFHRSFSAIMCVERAIKFAEQGTSVRARAFETLGLLISEPGEEQKLSKSTLAKLRPSSGKALWVQCFERAISEQQAVVNTVEQEAQAFGASLLDSDADGPAASMPASPSTSANPNHPRASLASTVADHGGVSGRTRDRSDSTKVKAGGCLSWLNSISDSLLRTDTARKMAERTYRIERESLSSIWSTLCSVAARHCPKAVLVNKTLLGMALEAVKCAPNSAAALFNLETLLRNGDESEEERQKYRLRAMKALCELKLKEFEHETGDGTAGLVSFNENAALLASFNSRATSAANLALAEKNSAISFNATGAATSGGLSGSLYAMMHDCPDLFEWILRNRLPLKSVKLRLFLSLFRPMHSEIMTLNSHFQVFMHGPKFKILGKGGEGTVYAGQETFIDGSEPVPLAVKRIRLDSGAEQDLLNTLLQRVSELSVLLNPKFENIIVRCRHVRITSIEIGGCQVPHVDIYMDRALTTLEKIVGDKEAQEVLIRAAKQRLPEGWDKDDKYANCVLRSGLPAFLVYDIGRKVLQHMLTLHDLSFTHNDIKPDNILLFDNLEVRLADFGFSKCIAEHVKLKRPKPHHSEARESDGDGGANRGGGSGGGSATGDHEASPKQHGDGKILGCTPGYMAPEAIKIAEEGKAPEGDRMRIFAPIDIYGAGATLAFLCNGEAPADPPAFPAAPGDDATDAERQLFNEQVEEFFNHEIYLDPCTPPELAFVVRQACRLDPLQRPTCAQLLQSRAFTSHRLRGLGEHSVTHYLIDGEDEANSK